MFSSCILDVLGCSPGTVDGPPSKCSKSETQCAVIESRDWGKCWVYVCAWFFLDDEGIRKFTYPFGFTVLIWEN